MIHKNKRPPIDELDQRIIHLLSEDARLSNRNMAQRLGVTEGTVRSRVRRLEDANYIRITAVTNMVAQSQSQLAYIGVDAEQDKIRLVADQLAEMEEINAVIIMLGRHDILAIGLFDSLEQAQRTASDKIQALMGVRNVETSIMVGVKKYNSGLAKIIVQQSDFKLKMR